MIKNIFFDFNGTILDDTDLCFDIEDEMIKEEGLTPVDKDFYLNNFCFPVKKYYQLVGFDISDENYNRISEKFFKKYLAREKEFTSLHKGIIDLLKNLKKDGYRLYILTASEESILINQLKQLGIFEYFDGFSASNNIAALGKIEYGKIFIKNNNINVNESLMIGDTLHDYEVAKELSLMPILFSQGHNSKKLLSTTDAKIVDSFDEFYKYLKNL